ncbi:MAG: hypothetical protein WDM89_19710 [Rhizomicrobium sp.]
MTYRCFNVTIADGIAHLQMNRPDELNSMVTEFWKELPTIVEETDDEAKARVIRHLLGPASISPRAWTLANFNSSTAGTSLATLERGRRAANLRHHVLDIQRSFNVLDHARMPVLVAIQGGCVGGGVRSDQRLRLPLCDRGRLLRGAGNQYRHDRRCRHLSAPVQAVARKAWCASWPYSGRRLPAKKALEFGLVNDIFPTQDAMMKHVMALAKEIAEKSPARRAWLESDDQLRTRPHDRRRSRLHRDLAGRHVQPRNRHARGDDRAQGKAYATIRRFAADSQKAGIMAAVFL